MSAFSFWHKVCIKTCLQTKWLQIIQLQIDRLNLRPEPDWIIYPSKLEKIFRADTLYGNFYIREQDHKPTCLYWGLKYFEELFMTYRYLTQGSKNLWQHIYEGIKLYTKSLIRIEHMVVAQKQRQNKKQYIFQEASGRHNNTLNVLMNA